MKKTLPVAIAAALTLVVVGGRPSEGQERDCVSCHEETSPGLVADWRASKHSGAGVTCVTCHRGAHTTAENPDETGMPTPATCAQCHRGRVEEYSKGKHAIAWPALKAMPTLHWQPLAVTSGMKGCGSCHKLGLKTAEEIQELKDDGQEYGVASCDVCHSRHGFSVVEARQARACQTCHMGFDHPQWEMYSSSKHGVRYLLNQSGALAGDAPAPTCQTCHMPGGDHEVRTAWGFLALRTDGLLRYPGEDEDWWWDRVTILQTLGILGPDGEPTKRLEAVEAADMARLSAEAFDAEREKAVAVCKEMAKSLREEGGA